MTPVSRASHLPGKGTVYALHALQAATELAMLDTLHTLRGPDPAMLPALHALLAAQPPRDTTPNGPLPQNVLRVIADFRLNDSQETAVAQALQALQGTSRAVCKVCV